MTAIRIGFQDWNNGGLLGEYARVEVKQLTASAVRDAAIHLVDDGCGYWSGVDSLPDGDENKVTEEEYALNPAYDRYWVHADKCPEAAEYSEAFSSTECMCPLNALFGGGEIEAPYEPEAVC